MSSDDTDAAKPDDGSDVSDAQSNDDSRLGANGLSAESQSADGQNAEGQVSEAPNAPGDGHGGDIEPIAPSAMPEPAPAGDPDSELSAFAVASAAAARAEAERAEADAAQTDAGETPGVEGDASTSDDPNAIWGADDVDYAAATDDDPGYVEVRRSAPGWAMSKWIVSGVVAAAVIVFSFLMIPRLFTPVEPESEAGTSTEPTQQTAAPTTTAAPKVTFPDAVMASGPAHYWKFDMQAAGSDSVGAASLEIGGNAGILGSSSYEGGMGSLDCRGTSKSRALSGLAESPSGDFSIEVWINAVTAEGGPIVTFGNKETAMSTKLDRVMYMATNGKIFFGAQGDKRMWTVTELPVNNGTWRHVVGTMSTTAGLTLYVDGEVVATEPEGIETSDFEGYWKICGDNPTGWTGNPGRAAFTGTIDDVAVYTKALTAKEVLDHYQAAKT